ncbi:uncharacterized protein TM35_000761040 [Trypanosoma theileri]|uniref:Mucin TcMUCII n=1 Tax=Trypanosoma theileri TaxID=67003 RepID=A0A1X0NFD5_9TRYP|nr:uncharacterized protein TM35_000761040 [Trypanosoma theileri]ORC83159.1 hypothetical protein TM35_000761040 [Trypanosoma theileri]
MIPMRHLLCVLVLSFCCVCGCVLATAGGEADRVGDALKTRDDVPHSEDAESEIHQQCDAEGEATEKRCTQKPTEELPLERKIVNQQGPDLKRDSPDTTLEIKGNGTTHTLNSSPQSQSQPQPDSPKPAEGVPCSTNSAGNTDPNCRAQTTAELSSPSPSERSPEGEQDPPGAGAKDITDKEGAAGASSAPAAKPDPSAPESDGEVSVSKGQPESNSNSADGNGTTENSSSNNSDTGSTSNSDAAKNDNGTSPAGSESTSNPSAAGSGDTTTTTTTTTTLPPELTNNKKGDADSSSSISSSVWVRVPLLIVVTLACILVC